MADVRHFGGLAGTAIVLLGVAGAFLYLGGWFSPEALTPARFADGFERVDGIYSGFRLNHAKGVCASGSFESNGRGARLSKAVVFKAGHVPIIGRNIYSYGSRDGEVDKPVVDRTGLQGRFDFTLELHYALFHFPIGPPHPDDTPPDPQGTRFLNAVREQLGLRLVSSRGAIRTLIIDHVERPSEN